MKKLTLPIKEVTILTDGALITRQKKVKLVKGEQTIIVTELSEYLDEDSIKVRGTGKVKLVDISPILQHVYRDEENLIEIEKEILKTEKEIEQKNLSLESLKVSITALITTIKSIAEGFGRYGMIKNKTVDDFKEYYSFYQSQIEAENAKKVQIEHEIIELNKLLNSLKEKKNQLQYLENEFYEVNIILDSKEECEIELELNYTVSNASWEPVYMIELTKGEASIQRLAKIYNRTRINWKKTKVTISTANRKPISIEEVDPLYLYLYEPVYPVAKKITKRELVKPKRAMKPMSMGVVEKELMQPPSPAPEAKLDDLYVESEKSTSIVGHQRFELGGKHDIPSGKTPKTLYLDSFKVEVEKQYYWSSLDEKLILTHKLKNKDQFLLLEQIENGKTVEELSLLTGQSISVLNSIVSLFEKNGILNFTGHFKRTPKKRVIQNVSFWVHLTDFCNLKCSYCYISTKETQKSMSQTVLDQLEFKIEELVKKIRILKKYI